jgi:hypothetical protein
MDLLKALNSIFNMWRPAFCKGAAFRRAKSLAIASLCGCGRKTITSMAIFLGRINKIPIADYKFFSEGTWNTENLFNPLLLTGAQYCPSDYITIAADDTKIHKTGKKIPHASWQADPMGPPFQVNLIWGLRYLQMSMILPLYTDSESTPPRAIPIRFISAPSVKKPGKKATKEQWTAYRNLSKQKNLSTSFVDNVKQLRATMDKMGLSHKTLIMSCDGSFCNKTCMNINDPKIIMMARCRKDAKLCFRAPANSRKIYDEAKLSPEQIRKDDTIPWETGSFFYGGQWREIRYKTVSNVLWQHGTKRKPLRLIVMAPLPYIRGGKKNYRDPAYILTTSLDAPIKILIQAYLDRWQIEYNHRDEKSVLGVGEAQVRNENSVVKQPAFHVAVYSAMLLANVMVYKDKPHSDFGERPKWRKKPKRNTCRALVGLLRSTLLEYSEGLKSMGLTAPQIAEILRQAA